MGGNQHERDRQEAIGPCSWPSVTFGLTLEVSGLILEALEICPHVKILALEFLSVIHFYFHF